MDVHVRVDLDDDGPVAVKAALGPAGAERLRHERARLLRAVHPGVVALAAADGADDELRIRYAGEPATRWSGPVDAVAGLGAAVAETLADLHDVGIVHGRVDATHILIGDDGRPRLCGLSGSGDARPADDVAALGEVLRELQARLPSGRRRRRRGAQRGGGGTGARRALERVVEAAVDPTPSRRPTARALADEIMHAVPAADLPAATGPRSQQEPDTLDRIWAVAGHESDDERWDAALGSGPRDLPLAASGHGGARRQGPDELTTPVLPLADLATPAWPEAAPAVHERGESTGPDPWGDPVPEPDEDRWAVDDIGGRRDRDRRAEPDGVAWAVADTDGWPEAAEPDEHRRPARPGLAAPARPWPGTDADTGEPHRPGVSLDSGAGGEVPRLADPVPDLTRERRPAAGRVAPSRAGTAEPSGSGRGRRWVAVAASGIAAAVATVAALQLIGSGRGADTSRPDPPAVAGCAPVEAPAADVDGDGCAEALVVDGSTVDAGVARWSLGEPGDVAAVGDWDCDGEASAALLRPATGDVFLFANWAELDAPVTVEATRQVADGVGIRAEPGQDGCDRLLVDLQGGGSTPVEVAR